MLDKHKITYQVDRLYDKIQQIDAQIDTCEDREDLKDYVILLHQQYRSLVKAQSKLENIVEFEIKRIIDLIEV